MNRGEICEDKAEDLRSANLIVAGIIRECKKYDRPLTDSEYDEAMEALGKADKCIKILRGV